MKLKIRTLLCASAATSLILSSCVNEAFETPVKEYYTRAFIDQFGLIDPDQDWNQAKSAQISVNVGAHADQVKVYAKAGATYYLTADLMDLSGKVDIPLDIPEGCNDLLVKVDGAQYKCAPGGSVNAANVHSRGAVTTSKNAQFTLDGVSYSVTIGSGYATGDDEYYYFNAQQMGPILAPVTPKDYNGTADLDDPTNTVGSNYYWSDYYSLASAQPGMVTNPRTTPGGLIPEHTDNVGRPNVFQDIRIAPDANAGGIVIYPMYWYTGNTHNLSVYLIDENDDPVRDTDGKIITFPVYTQKKYNSGTAPWDIEWYKKEAAPSTGGGNESENPDESEIILSQSNQDIPAAIKAEWYTDQEGFKYYNNPTELANFIQAFNTYYKNGGDMGVLKDGYQDAEAPDPSLYDITDIENQGANAWHYSIIITFTKTASDDATVDDEEDDDSVTESTVPYALLNDGNGTWSQPYWTDTQCCYQFRDQMLMRSHGVKISIDGWSGKIGFCTTVGGGTNIYSQAKVNKAEADSGRGIGLNNTSYTDASGLYPYSYAAFYFHPITKTPLYSFEDWTGGGGDADLNDMVFMVKGIDHVESDKGKIPVKVTNESTTEQTLSWIVAAEDMGSVGDFDFNDMIFKLSSITTNHTVYYNEYGDIEQTFELASTVTKEIRKVIRVQALAAGGVKRLWLHFNDGENDYILGPDKVVLNDGTTDVDDCEWHRWFGRTENSIINTGIQTARNPASCVLGAFNSITETVNGVTGDGAATAEGLWNKLALQMFSVDSYFQSTKNGTIQGFYVTVNSPAAGSNLESIGDDDYMITPANMGEAPQMFLIPDVGTTVVVEGESKTNPWNWPTEYTHITKAYPRFKNWVNNASGNADWHTDTPSSGTTTRPVD